MRKTKEFVPYMRGNKWIYYYYVVNEFGLKKTKFSSSFNSEAEAKEDASKRKNHLDSMSKESNASTKLSDYLNRWVKHDYQPTVRPCTFRGAEANIRVHINPVIGNKPLGKLTRKDIEKLIKILLNEGLSASSVRFVYFTIRKALNDAINDDIISHNPCEGISMPASRPHRRSLVPPDESKDFLELARKHGIYNEVLLGLNFGLRRGEILGLQFRDFDFENNRLYIVRQIGRYQTNDSMSDEIPKYGWTVIDNLKSKRSECRPLSVSPAMKEFILDLKDRYIKSKVCSAAKIDKCFVCCRSDGSFKTPDCIRKPFEALKKDAGRPELRFHDLRHTFASYLIEEGIPIAVVSSALGHASVDTTYKSYYDVINADKDVASTMAKSLF